MDTRHLFDEISEWDVVSWVAMIEGYAKNGHDSEALEVFDEMQHVVYWNPIWSPLYVCKMQEYRECASSVRW